MELIHFPVQDCHWIVWRRYGWTDIRSKWSCRRLVFWFLVFCWETPSPLAMLLEKSSRFTCYGN